MGLIFFVGPPDQKKQENRSNKCEQHPLNVSFSVLVWAKCAVQVLKSEAKAFQLCPDGLNSALLM